MQSKKLTKNLLFLFGLNNNNVLDLSCLELV